MSEVSEAAASIGKVIGGRRTYSGTRKWWRAGNHEGLQWRVSLNTEDDALSVMVKPSEADLRADKLTFTATGSFPTFKSDDAEDVEYEDAEQFVSDVVDIAQEQILRESIRREISSLLFD